MGKRNDKSQPGLGSRTGPTDDVFRAEGTGAPRGMQQKKGEYRSAAPRRKKGLLSGLLSLDTRWQIALVAIPLGITAIINWTHLTDRVDTIGNHVDKINGTMDKEAEAMQQIRTDVAVQQQQISEIGSDIKEIKEDKQKDKRK